MFDWVLNASLNPLTTNLPHHIEASELICIANQLAGFCIMGNIVWLWVTIWVILCCRRRRYILETPREIPLKEFDFQ